MRLVVRMMRATLLVAVAGLLLSAGAWAQSEEQQSLGDVARQEKAKKKKVLTNEDLPQGTVTSGSEPASSSSGAQASEEKSDAAAKEGEAAKAEDQDASMTKAQGADAAKQELESLKHDEASLDNGIKRLEEKLANETSDSLREVYSNALKHAQQNLADTQKKRAEAEKKAAAAQAGAQNQPPQEQPPQ